MFIHVHTVGLLCIIFAASFLGHVELFIHLCVLTRYAFKRQVDRSRFLEPGFVEGMKYTQRKSAI